MKKILMVLTLAVILAAVPVMAQNNDQGVGSTADGGQTQPGSDQAGGDDSESIVSDQGDDGAAGAGEEEGSPYPL